MRVVFYGRKNNFIGKTLWEIVGNLKNFGVGRLVKRGSGPHFPEPCYFKILDVQPLPPPKGEYEDRNVIATVEEVFRGRKLPPAEICKGNDIADFQLIPKHEESLYTSVKVNPEVYQRVVYTYTAWPPLYKKRWESEHVRINKVYKPIPPLKSVPPNETKYELIMSDEKINELATSSYLKTDVPVEEMYKEIVRLKKLIKLKSS